MVVGLDDAVGGAALARDVAVGKKKEKRVRDGSYLIMLSQSPL